MHKKMVRFSTMAALTLLLLLPISSYAAVAYMPQALRNCINAAYEIARKSNRAYNHLAELHAMVAEQRVLTSDNVMRKGLQEALAILNDSTNMQTKAQRESMKQYLREYVKSLDTLSSVFRLHGAAGQQRSWPLSLIAGSLSDNPNNVDMMCLSSLLTSVDTIELCGNIVEQTRLFDHNVSFNANMMTSALYPTPNIIFGTGVTSPVINAWSMSPSYIFQSPINMQLAVPSALFIERAEMLDLHFLSAKMGVENGRARVAVSVKYMGQYGEFNILDSSPLFTYTVESKDFKIFEPIYADQVRHVCVTVPLEKTLINKCNLIILSIIRIAPDMEEYNEDIYLAAAVVRYTQI